MPSFVRNGFLSGLYTCLLIALSEPIPRLLSQSSRTSTATHPEVAWDVGDISQEHVSDRHSRAGEVPPPAPGLPDECLTYYERFHQHRQGLRHSFAANALHLHSKYVVVLKMHQVHGCKLPQDLVLSLRSIAAETTQAGYHFYILYQPPTRDFYMLEEVKETRLTREEVMECLPLDLHHFVIIHDFEEDFAFYPALSKDDENVYPKDLWGPGPRAAFVSMSRFMQRYQAYEYAWIVEYDARWLGRSWGHLFNAALSLAAQATEEEIAGNSISQIYMDRVASRALPGSYDGLPDLLTMLRLRPSSQWQGRNMENVTTMWEMPASVYMGSRRLWDAVHQDALHGRGSHLEGFLPTVAKQHGMKAAALALAAPPEHPLSFHCCTPDAEDLYEAWFNDSAACTPSYLVHAVKNRKPFWQALRTMD